MSQRIIRINEVDTDVDWSEVDEKPTIFPPEPHNHDWNNILNEPDFAPATHDHSGYASSSHNHPIEQVTGFRSENPMGFDFNAQINSGFYSVLNAPNAPTSGWVNVVTIRHPLSSNNNQCQIASPMLQNTDFYIRNLNPAASLVAWRKLWHDGNLLISSGNWLPTLTVNNGAVLSYTTQTGTFVRQGRMCHLSFDLLGALAEGSTIPNNALTINSSTNFLPFTPTKRGANCLGYFAPTSKPAHRVAVAGGSNLIVFYKYNSVGGFIQDTAYTWTDLLSVATGFQISGNISYEIA